MNALVDVELYAPNGQRVHQQVFDNQAFVASQQRSFPVAWSVPNTAAAGVYAVKIGVFSPGWGTVYSWNDNATTFAVGSAGPQCSPRPPVTTSVVKEGPGVLRATITATGANNTIRRLDFTPRNAIVRGTGLPDQTAQFSTTPLSTSTTFRVVQRTPGAAQVNLVVTDGCGTWQTFVGGGPTAF
jgi:hypothetical protein